MIRPESRTLPDARELRVVILSDAIVSRNGVGTYYEDLAQHLADRVEAVTLLAPSADEKAEFRGFAFPMPGDPTQKLYWPSPIWLGQVIRNLDPHVIISATPGGYGMLGLAMAAYLKTAFCVGYHTEYSELAGLYWSRTSGKVYNALLALWDSLMFRFGSLVMVTNEALRERALSLGAVEAHIVGTPVQDAFLARPHPPPPREVRTVTFIGRLAPEKELGQVLESADAFPHLSFRVAGDGPLRGDVEEWSRSRPNLDYVGWVPRSRVLELLDDTDLLVLPSRFETFGTVAFEAMIRGRLALVSRNCGIRRWPDLAPGLLTMEEGEPLRRAMGRILAMEPEALEATARRGMEASRAMSRKTVDDWVALLRRAVAEKRFA